MAFYTHCQSCGERFVSRLGNGHEAYGSYVPTCKKCEAQQQVAQGEYCQGCGAALSLAESVICDRCRYAQVR